MYAEHGVVEPNASNKWSNKCTTNSNFLSVQTQDFGNPHNQHIETCLENVTWVKLKWSESRGIQFISLSYSLDIS